MFNLQIFHKNGDFLHSYQGVNQVPRVGEDITLFYGNTLTVKEVRWQLDIQTATLIVE